MCDAIINKKFTDFIGNISFGDEAEIDGGSRVSQGDGTVDGLACLAMAPKSMEALLCKVMV